MKSSVGKNLPTVHLFSTLLVTAEATADTGASLGLSSVRKA